MFIAGASAATIALSYLPIVTAAPGMVVETVKQSKAEQVVEEDGLKWELQNCQRVAQKVTCNFFVTNMGESDRYVSFHGGYSSRIIDLSGNEYPAKGGQIGNKDSTILITGIPIKASVNFELPQKITEFAILEVVNYNSTGGDTKIKFRDVNVSGSQASSPGNPKTCTCPPQNNPKKPG